MPDTAKDPTFSPTEGDDDPDRCISVHWSLPVRCVLKSSHRENWHEAWHPETGNRMRYRYPARRTEELRGETWQTLYEDADAMRRRMTDDIAAARTTYVTAKNRYESLYHELAEFEREQREATHG